MMQNISSDKGLVTNGTKSLPNLMYF